MVDVMTVCLGLLFSFHLFPFFPLSHLDYCTMDTLPSLLVTVLSWTYSLIPRLGQDALRTVHPFPYLLHALPSLLLQYLHVHQDLLMCTFHAPPMPISPHCCLMYHCTICARYVTARRAGRTVMVFYVSRVEIATRLWSQCS